MWTLAAMTTNSEIQFVVKIGRCWRRRAMVGSVMPRPYAPAAVVSIIADVDWLHKAAHKRN